MSTQTAVAEKMQRAYLEGRTRQDSIVSTGQSGAMNLGFSAGQSKAHIYKTHSARIYPETLKEALSTIAVQHCKAD